MVRKYVITGESYAGKTTLINLAKIEGIYTVENSISYVMRDEFRKLNENDKIGPTQNHRFFYRESLKTQKKWETEIPDTTEIAFLDEGIIDMIALSRYFQVDPIRELVEETRKTRYEKIFILEPNEKWIAGIKRKKEYIEDAYKDFGYSPIPVPFMPTKDRLEFILEKI